MINPLIQEPMCVTISTKLHTHLITPYIEYLFITQSIS